VLSEFDTDMQAALGGVVQSGFGGKIIGVSSIVILGTRARGTPLTRRDSRATRHDPDLKISGWPAPQVTTSQARKIEANAALTLGYLRPQNQETRHVRRLPHSTSPSQLPH
jgi:hypothetical protein